MKNLKIAIFEPSRVFPGGGQKVIPDVAKHLSKENEVTLFTQKIYDKNLDFGKAKKVFIRPANRYLAPFAFMSYKLKQKFDLVIYGCFPATLAVHVNSRIPSIHISHAPPRFFYDLKEEMLKTANFREKIKIRIKEIFFKKLEKISVMKMGKILAISEEIHRRVREYYHCDSKVFYPGINPKSYHAGKYKKYFLAPGKIVFNKRPKMIIESIKFLKNKEIKIIFVGSGNMSKEINKESKKYDQIEFRGFVSDEELRNLYSNCLAVIYIPINEDYGYIPVEAAACGKATIGANEGGLKETVIHKKTGILIDKVTSKKLALEIDFLANNPKIAKMLGLAAKKYSKKFYLRESFKILDQTIEETLNRERTNL